MIRTLSFLFVGGLLVAAASAAPSTCAHGKFFDKATGSCKPCNNSRVVKTCSSGSVATSCVSRYYLTADGRCVASGQCPVSTFANHSNGTCDKCFLPTYKTCSNGRSYSATSCTTRHCLGAGRCMPFARIKSTAHCNKNGTISPCPGQGASTCAVDGTTLSCNAPYFLNATIAAPSPKINNTVIVQRATVGNGTCVSSTGCGRAFYPDSKTRTCAPCGEHVARCDETGALECEYGLLLSEGKCVGTCPEGQKGLNGACVDQSYCPSGMYEPFTKACRESCYATTSEAGGLFIPAEYPSNDGKICLVCKSEHAFECDQTTGLAVSCVNGYFLLDGQCYNPCPEGWTGKEGNCVKDEPTPTTPTLTAPEPADTCTNAPIWTDESNCVPTQAANPPGKYQGRASFTYKGCYKSNLQNRQGKPLALQPFYGLTQMTQKQCLLFVESKGMPVAALTNGNQCLGGFALPSDIIPAAPEECAAAAMGAKCEGDRSSDCGGRGSMDVYVRQCASQRMGPSNACLDGYLGFKYNGCHTGDLYGTYGNTVISLSMSNMTMDGCLRACKAKPGVKYCSMAEGWICHGSATLDADPAASTAKYAPITETFCSVPCFDNQAQQCGGPRIKPSLFDGNSYTTVFSSYSLPDP